jgi:hypothetical protein
MTPEAAADRIADAKDRVLRWIVAQLAPYINELRPTGATISNCTIQGSPGGGPAITIVDSELRIPARAYVTGS